MTELPLFSLPSTTTNTIEEKILQPVSEVLDNPIENKKTSTTVKQSLDDLFPEQAYEEKQIKKAKEMLGELANQFTTVELKDTITEIQFLANSWLDDFERGIFHGLTLQELLHEKGGT